MSGRAPPCVSQTIVNAKANTSPSRDAPTSVYRTSGSMAFRRTSADLARLEIGLHPGIVHLHDFLHRSLGDYLSVGEHDHAVDDGEQCVEIVRNHQDRQPEVVAKEPQQRV